MAEVVAAKPVPIRLAQRYPNGSMVSYSARALSHDEDSVRVVVNEEFEAGITLAIMAPFLEGLTTGKVCSVRRSRKQPGYFEIILRFGNVAAGAPAPAAGTSQDEREEKAPRQSEPDQAVPDAVVHAAEKLAEELQRLPARRFSEVLNQIRSHLRPVSLLVAVAAVIHLLQEKGHVDARRLMLSAKEAIAK